MMNLRRSQLEMQAKEKKSDDNTKDYPTLADLMKEQNLPLDNSNTVHYRRDLDSLG